MKSVELILAHMLDDRDFTRTIFSDDGFENIDETCSRGAYVGGVAGVHADVGMAQSYKRAADILVEEALVDDSVFDIVLPVLFLYRQALELRLKVAVQPKKLNQDLRALITELDALMVQKRGVGIAPEIVARVCEINDMDPGADGFRFHVARPKNVKSSHAPLNKSGDEVWVDIAYLQDFVACADLELLHCAGLLGR
jgi:hypothetical protein